MITNYTYKLTRNARTAIRAVIASTCIVFINKGEAMTYPEKRG